MKQITVVTLGPGSPNYLTRQAEKTLRESRHLILRTSRHQVAAWLTREGVAFRDCDDFYDRYDDFDAMHQAMAAFLWEEACHHRVTFAVQDAASDGAVRALRDNRPKDAVLQIIPGVSSREICLAQAETPAESCLTVTAMRLDSLLLNPSVPLLVTEIDSPLLAGNTKLILSDLYGDEHPVFFFPSTANRSRKPIRLPLCEADRQSTYDHTVCLLVPPADLADRDRYCFGDLLRIMTRLRAEDGCPWDRKQTHQSLRKYLLEEAYEAAGAIDEKDMNHLADELGDVLLQIVFHAEIGRELGEFSISDVTTAICAKMLRRHPHVFGQADWRTADQVSDNWEQLKRQERHQQLQAQALSDVSAALPALTRAAKVQAKAARVGFDWTSAAEALPKVAEEAEEVRAELDAGREPQEELGDLLFAAVNVVRLAGCDPEETLTLATGKFVRRFTEMEQRILRDGKRLEDMTLAEMDHYWDLVKQSE